MNRRNFIINSAFASTALISTNYLFSSETDNSRYNFNLNYAPHLGMFTNSAGTDPVDQLKFMYDQGFTAFEDNNMKKRDVIYKTDWLILCLKTICKWEFSLLIQFIGKNLI